jgi:hypothetical protein
VYLADVTFSETLAQSLVSVNIAVKSEIAASNSMAKDISSMTTAIQDQILEALEKVLNTYTYSWLWCYSSIMS